MASKASLLVPALLRAPLWAGFALSCHHRPDVASHGRAAVGWLLRTARVAGSGGFAHSLHFARGWLPAYPETTGYILPTLDLASRHYGVAEAVPAVAAAWQWLREIQGTDGSFPDLAGKPQVFDTGQILIGASHMIRSGGTGATKVARLACLWLVDQQSEDGSFVKNSYNARPHAYYSRVGAALIAAGQALSLQLVVDAGLRNLDWALRQQESDGWFNYMSFADHEPYSHTMVYALEGLLAGYRLTGEQRLLDAVVSFSVRLRDAIAKHGGVIRSQYGQGYLPVDSQICVTGLCQWSALCFRLDRLGVPGFKPEAVKSLTAAMQIQLRSPMPELDGALPGSVPLSGRYMRYSLPNWGVKFFLDALLEADGIADMPPLV